MRQLGDHVGTWQWSRENPSKYKKKRDCWKIAWELIRRVILSCQKQIFYGQPDRFFCAFPFSHKENFSGAENQTLALDGYSTILRQDFRWNTEAFNILVQITIFPICSLLTDFRVQPRANKALRAKYEELMKRMTRGETHINMGHTNKSKTVNTEKEYMNFNWFYSGSVKSASKNAK